MINREITYERDINKSYMKIPAVPEESFDEKILLRNKFDGSIPVEKCFINGKGQYWYNISGKMALDAYCRVNQIGQNFFETLILRICSQLEILEWNLMDSNCLIVDPELIFVNSTGEEFSFVLYPQTKGDFFAELQELMEYLLTKLNHSDKEAVHAAYEIYELTLADSYNVSTLKEAILQRRMQEKKQEQKKEEEIKWEREETKELQREIELSFSLPKEIEEHITKLFDKIKEILKRENKEEIPEVVYPEEEYKEEQVEIHPTVCLAATLGETRGVLVYEGTGGYPDFEIGQMMCVIGKNHRVRMRIERETISQFHAKIDYFGDTYYIEDMNSTNGTYVNEELLRYKEKRMLRSGDVIRFADVKYRFV